MCEAPLDRWFEGALCFFGDGRDVGIAILVVENLLGFAKPSESGGATEGLPHNKYYNGTV